MGKIRLNKKVVLSAIGVVLLIVAAGSAGILLRKTQDAKKEDQASQIGKLPENVSEIQDLQSAGNQDAADAKIDAILKSDTSSDTDKYNAYIQRGNGLDSQQDFAGAIKAYESALAVKETYEIVFLLAETNEHAGNTAEAVKHYRRALKIIPDGPISHATRIGLRTKLKALGAEE